MSEQWTPEKHAEARAKLALAAAGLAVRARVAQLERELATWRAKQPRLDQLADLLNVCEGVCPLPAAVTRIIVLGNELGAARKRIEELEQRNA